jgi:hypothetical protein
MIWETMLVIYYLIFDLIMIKIIIRDSVEKKYKEEVGILRIYIPI